jgi:hypothetical protein
MQASIDIPPRRCSAGWDDRHRREGRVFQRTFVRSFVVCSGETRKGNEPQEREEWTTFASDVSGTMATSGYRREVGLRARAVRASKHRVDFIGTAWCMLMLSRVATVTTRSSRLLTSSSSSSSHHHRSSSLIIIPVISSARPQPNGPLKPYLLSELVLK